MSGRRGDKSQVRTLHRAPFVACRRVVSLHNVKRFKIGPHSLTLGSMKKMLGLPRPWWGWAKKANQHEPLSMPLYGVWEAVARFAAEIRVSDFMAEMTQRCRAYGTQGLMSG